MFKARVHVSRTVLLQALQAWREAHPLAPPQLPASA